MADEIATAIEASAVGPKSASVDGVSVQQHSIADLIAADKHIGSRTARLDPRNAIFRVKIMPPGAD